MNSHEAFGRLLRCNDDRRVMSGSGHLRRLTDVQSWSARPPIATVTADAVVPRLRARTGQNWLHQETWPVRFLSKQIHDTLSRTLPPMSTSGDFVRTDCVQRLISTRSRARREGLIVPLLAIERAPRLQGERGAAAGPLKGAAGGWIARKPELTEHRVQELRIAAARLGQHHGLFFERDATSNNPFPAPTRVPA
jgi:hypothetical protein